MRGGEKEREIEGVRKEENEEEEGKKEEKERRGIMGE